MRLELNYYFGSRIRIKIADTFTGMANIVGKYTRNSDSKLHSGHLEQLSIGYAKYDPHSVTKSSLLCRFI
jgi:hypothetical protein